MDSVKNNDDMKHAAYTVYYNSESHWSVITQWHGSVLPKVLPYCLFNVCLMILITWIDEQFSGKYSLEISTQAHTFMTLIVSFLLVSRVNIALSRYNQARDCLGAMYRESRELIQNVCVFSSHLKDDDAKQWRNLVAYRCLLLLRTAMAVIDYPTTLVPAWEIPEFMGEEREEIKRAIFLGPDIKRWGHKERSEWEETMRVPIRVAYLLRQAVHSQGDKLEKPLQLAHENRMHGSIDGFMGGYYGMRKFLTTPVPFPLIQLARTFLFLYVFTVPFVMLSDNSGHVPHCVAVFLMTYGFVAIEFVAIELDNPFGDDANDFDNNALACTAYEDTYMTILDLDGLEWADRLRYRMHNGTADESITTEATWLLSAKMV